MSWILLLQHRLHSFNSAEALAVELNILVVDDHPLVTEAIGASASTVGNFKIFSASSAVEMRGMLDSMSRRGQTIHAAFVDIHLPDADGSDLILELKDEYKIPSVAISALCDEMIVMSCVKKGAAGFIQKSSKLTVFATALSVVLAGGQYFPPSLISGGSSSKANVIRNLSEKQRQILDLILQGKTNKQIAEEIYLAEGTIKNKVTELLEIFQVSSRVQIIFAAGQLGYRPRTHNLAGEI